ncbi:glyoxalase family protein [Seinonella peptonophila]|uniref:Glyoxalase family protein n=1 Tax=Seinonella peptonophila TaxID=112248 RepID=A0A1M4SPK6_9BACL|nr:VOC family protein [Seinonella peptonophila]SHE34150.1 glyoxalase family protein [Seinonella peptonophila]
MKLKTAGIHHITAFVYDAQRNVNFYVGVLGLRLIKKTVNFDAPEVYHLYFGDQIGTPGSVITFFPFNQGKRGRIGGGQVGSVTFAIPIGAISFWEDRLKNYDVTYQVIERFDEMYLCFQDPDGVQLELVERADGENSEWSVEGISTIHAIKGLGGAKLYSLSPNKTLGLLQEGLGLERIAEDSNWIRLSSYGALGNIIDLNRNSIERGMGGLGTVHHIAWRTQDQEEHLRWREKILSLGLQPTDQVDRQYFLALYFREPGGILFEISTDSPGFTVDEPIDQLGRNLKLPLWLEPHRNELEQLLPPINVRALEGDQT